MTRVKFLCVLLFAFVSFSSANAQTTKKAPAQSETKSNLIKAVDDYKESLQKMVDIYNQDVKTATDHNAQLKELFDQGLISKRELEKGAQDIATAQAKVTDIQNQLKLADSMKATSTVATVMIPGQVTNTNWTTGSAAIDGYIRQYGNLYGVDPFLVFCLINQESGFHSGATSVKGAQGLMQLMPDTAARYGVTKPYDIEQNIKAGTKYLKDLLVMFKGNTSLALAGYNAGEGAVMKYGYQIPPYSETQNYVKSIVARYSAVPAKKDTKVKSEDSADHDSGN